MAKQRIGIICSNPKRHPSHQCFRVSYDGRVLGDSRGYDRSRAIEEARAIVARDPENRFLDSVLFYETLTRR